MPMIRVRIRANLAQIAPHSIDIIRLFSVSDSRMKNPHNPDVDILRLKPLYNGSTYIYVGRYGSRISRYSERVLQGGIMSRVPLAK